MKLKYLIFHTTDGIPVPVIFPEVIQHKDVKLDGTGPAISGGFVRLGASDDGKVFATCYGESTSLGLKPSPGDKADIEAWLSHK